MSITLGAIALSVVALAASEPALAQDVTDVGMYFNISDDPQSPKLLHLDEIASEGDLRYLPVTDIFGGDRPVGLLSVFQIDCPAETMSIVAAAQLTPATTDPDIRPMEIDDAIDARASEWSWTMYRLACDGEADLERRRVYQATYADVLARFWRR